MSSNSRTHIRPFSTKRSKGKDPIFTIVPVDWLEDVDHMSCRSGLAHGLYKTACSEYCDEATHLLPPCCKCAHFHCHEQLAVFHFSSDVLGSSAPLFHCVITAKESSEILRIAQRPKLCNGAWSLTCRKAGNMHRVLPRRTSHMLVSDQVHAFQWL